MKTKLDMAHDYALEILKPMLSGDVDMEEFSEIASDAWKLADAMQAEADKREVKGVPEAIRNYPEIPEGWQPDWSQAPKHMNYFVVDDQGFGMWFMFKPECIVNRWICSIKAPYDKPNAKHAPSFNYTGNWKDSLRKRP